MLPLQIQECAHHISNGALCHLPLTPVARKMWNNKWKAADSACQLFRDKIRGEQRVNLPHPALEHRSSKLQLQLDLRGLLLCSFRCINALESLRAVSQKTESNILVLHYWKILPKQYHISPTQWHSLENKAKKSGRTSEAEAKHTSIKGQIMNVRKMGLITYAKIWFEPVLMDCSLLLRKTSSSALIGSL